MGIELLNFYHNKIRKTWKLAFFSAFIIGFLVHIFKFTNMLPNWDALHNFYNSQNMVATGRWFLTVACGFSSYFDIPWFTGLLCLVYMSLTAAVVAEVFRMENPCLIVLTSGLLVSFPAVTATFSYEYTADGYMLAMLLAALSVSFSRMEDIDKSHWKQLILSAVCICLACGIYQAYLSFAFVLAVCYFMTELLENKRTTAQYWKWIAAQVIIYGCALAGYYVLWKLCLKVQGFTASSYQGLDQVGVLDIAGLIGMLLKIVKQFMLFFLEWNILEHGVTVYSVLNILFLISFTAGVLIALVKSGCMKRKQHLILFLLCLAALPVGCYICYLTSPRVFYHALMLQSICLLYIFVAVLFERWFQPKFSNLAMLLLAAIVFHNSLTANIYYTLMDQSMKRTQATMTEISTRIHLLDDGSIRYVVFFGGTNSWGQEDHFIGGHLRELGPWKKIDKTLVSPMFLATYCDFDLSYYRSRNLEYPIVEWGPELPAPDDWKFRFPAPGLEEQARLQQTEEVKNMPSWPARDSIQVIGDTIVVKLSEVEP